MRSKRGQVFLLAAVIIAVIITGLAVTRNYVVAKEEPRKFFDLSEEIKSESGRVIDFGVYEPEIEDIVKSNDLAEDFVVRVEENLHDLDPENELIFVYGNKEEFRIVNLAASDLIIDGGDTLSGARESFPSTISLGGGATIPVVTNAKVFNDEWKRVVVSGGDNVLIEFNGQEYPFDLGDNQRFYMIIKKEVGDNVYIDAR